MDILGIGMPELVFIVLIALIVLGPKDMQKAGKTIGAWMRKVVMSSEWREIKDASHKLKSIPAELMREANPDLDQSRNDMQATLPQDPFGTWGGTLNSIAPLVDKKPAPAKPADTNQEAASANSAVDPKPHNA